MTMVALHESTPDVQVATALMVVATKKRTTGWKMKMQTMVDAVVPQLHLKLLPLVTTAAAAPGPALVVLVMDHKEMKVVDVGAAEVTVVTKGMIEVIALKD